MKFSVQMLDAMAETMLAYDQAILDLEQNNVRVKTVLDRWESYGRMDTCRLCKVVNIEFMWGARDNNCRGCILAIGGYVGCALGDMSKSMNYLVDTIDSYHLRTVTRVRRARLAKLFRQRRAALRRALVKQGYELTKA